MKFTIRHLLLLTLLVAVLIPAGIAISRYLHPPPDPEVAKFLLQLNDWDAGELYLYNNSEIATQRNYQVAGESIAHIETLMEILAECGHDVEWNNKTRRYQFAQ